ncbi:hypothetical protein ACFLXI_03910, partial [Chloroflexota bacterium]
FFVLCSLIPLILPWFRTYLSPNSGESGNEPDSWKIGAAPLMIGSSCFLATGTSLTQVCISKFSPFSWPFEAHRD